MKATFPAPSKIFDLAAKYQLDLLGQVGLEQVVNADNKQLSSLVLLWSGFQTVVMQTGEFKRFEVMPVFANELKSFNPLVGNQYDFSKRVHSVFPLNTVVGYAGYFETVKGFVGECYLPQEKVHALCQNLTGLSARLLVTQKEDMARLQVALHLLNTYAPYGATSTAIREITEFVEYTPCEPSESSERVASVPEIVISDTEDVLGEIVEVSTATLPQATEETEAETIAVSTPETATAEVVTQPETEPETDTPAETEQETKQAAEQTAETEAERKTEKKSRTPKAAKKGAKSAKAKTPKPKKAPSKEKPIEKTDEVTAEVTATKPEPTKAPTRKPRANKAAPKPTQEVAPKPSEQQVTPPTPQSFDDIFNSLNGISDSVMVISEQTTPIDKDELDSAEN